MAAFCPICLGNSYRTKTSELLEVLGRNNVRCFDAKSFATRIRFEHQKRWDGQIPVDGGRANNEADKYANDAGTVYAETP